MLQRVIFVLLLTSLVVTETRASQAISNHKITFSHRAVGATTTTTVKFTLAQDFEKNTGNSDVTEAIDITFPSGFTLTNGVTTASITTGCGSATLGTTAVAGQVVTIPLASNKIPAATNCEIAISNVINPNSFLGANNAGFKIEVEDETTGDSANAGSPLNGGSVDTGLQFTTNSGTTESIGGAPLLYALTSECRSLGEAAGAKTNCAEDPCKQCVAKDCAFYTVHGTGCTAAADTRCDAMYKTHNSLDIYVNTNGVEGTLWCGAFRSEFVWATNNPDALSLGSMFPYVCRKQADNTVSGGCLDTVTDEETCLAAKDIGGSTACVFNNPSSTGSVVIDAADSKTDHVATLIDLKPDTQYNIYCHMNDVTASTVLKVHTDPYPYVWDNSLVRSHTIAGSTAGTLTLTFTHGHDLSTASTKIKLKTSAAIWTSTSATDCVATSNGAAMTADALSVRNPSTTSEIEFAFHANHKSYAGSTIVIHCGTILTNPAANTISYDLWVTGHEALIKQPGPIITNS